MSAQYRSVAFRITPTVIADLANRATQAESDIALRAVASDVTQQLSQKADASALVGLASESYVQTAVAGKADAADLANLASTMYVDNAVAPLATQAAVTAAINNIQLTPGPQGPQGEPGPMGPQGPQGEAGTPADATLLNAVAQGMEVLVGPTGAFQVSQTPGSSNIYVYDGTVQTLS